MIVSELWQYPVKGLAGITLDSVRLEAGKHFPGDRRFAVTKGHPKPVSYTHLTLPTKA